MLLYITYNSTLYKNAGFSLDKRYAIFPQILWLSPIFPSPWYFFSRHFKCRGIFQKYNGRWENTMSKNRSWFKIVEYFTFRCSRDLSSSNDNHIFGGIIEIYHDSGNLSSLSTSIFWQIPLTSMVYFYKSQWIVVS